MRIGEVAAEAGVSTRVLRYYEQQHLLTSARTGTSARTIRVPMRPGHMRRPFSRGA